MRGCERPARRRPPGRTQGPSWRSSWNSRGASSARSVWTRRAKATDRAGRWSPRPISPRESWQAAVSDVDIASVVREGKGKMPKFESAARRCPARPGRSHSIDAQSMMQTFRSGRLIVLAAALAACAWFARLAPTDQTVHYVLGDASPRVEELRVRWQEDEPPSRVGDEWLREVSYRFTPGEAPRIVTHEPRLRNGRYAVEIDVVLVEWSVPPPSSVGASSSRGGPFQSTWAPPCLGLGLTRVLEPRPTPRRMAGSEFNDVSTCNLDYELGRNLV